MSVAPPNVQRVELAQKLLTAFVQDLKGRGYRRGSGPLPAQQEFVLAGGALLFWEPTEVRTPEAPRQAPPVGDDVTQRPIPGTAVRWLRRYKGRSVWTEGRVVYSGWLRDLGDPGSWQSGQERLEFKRCRPPVFQSDSHRTKVQLLRPSGARGPWTVIVRGEYRWHHPAAGTVFEVVG